MNIDFAVENHFSIFLLRPLSDAAREWIAEHIPADAQFWGSAVVVEPRCIGDIVRGARADGLVLR